MFNVSVTNNSGVPLSGSDGTKLPPSGGMWKTTSQALSGWGFVLTPFGPAGFVDIGANHIPGDSSETWGVLLAYQGMSVVGRYEGQGQLVLDLDTFLQVGMEGMDFREVELEGLVLPQNVTASD